MLPPAQGQPAFVLHRRPFRETSAIVELLTRDFGRVSGVARGAKRSRRQGQDIEPFGEVAVSWRGRGQMVTIIRSEPVVPRRLTGDALFAGLYLNELLIKTLSHEEPVFGLFEHYGNVLAQLEGDLEAALRTFERRLLEELGYGLAFDADVRSRRPIDPGKSYLVVDGEGFREANGERAERDELLLTGRQIAAIDAQRFAEPGVRSAAKQVFRRALSRRLGGRTLATRQLFAVRNRMAATHG